MTMKPSSRAGRFKKKLISETQLKIEAPRFLEALAPYQELLRQKKMTSAEFAAFYIISALSLRYPGTWLGSKRVSTEAHAMDYPLNLALFEPNIRERLKGLQSVGDVFTAFALKSTPLTVNRALLAWSRGDYQLELMFRIPSPREVLNQQKQGHRCLTLLCEERQISDYILGDRDYLSFGMHDLIHADHFYFHNDCYQGQLGFYGLLDQCLSRGDFDELLKLPKFAAEFEYVISDMNAYAIHLMKCLKSAIVHYGSEVVFADWVKDFEVSESLLLLNTREYVQEERDQLILDWLQNFVAE